MASFLNMLSRVFWDEVVTDQIVSPFLNRLDPVGEKGLLSLWRDHLSSLLDDQKSTHQQPPNKAAAAPKKKTNYQVFFSLMHPIIKKDNPSVSFRDISKVVSQKWHELSPDQKAAYVDQTSQSIRQPPVLQTAPPVQQPAAVDFHEEDEAFQILAGGADVVHDDASTEDSGIDDEEDEVYDITDNEEEYDDDDAGDHFDDDNDSKISITDDP